MPKASRALLWGRPGPLPFTGYFGGTLGAVSWAGRVACDDEPEVAWRAARSVDRALRRRGEPKADRRRALSILWTRLDGTDRDDLGTLAGADFTLLLVAVDDAGASISGIGLSRVHAVQGERASPWIVAPHPMLGPPGFPTSRPGAVTIEAAPRWLVATPHGETVDPVGLSLETLALRCGVQP